MKALRYRTSLNLDRTVVCSSSQDAAEQVAALYARLGAPANTFGEVFEVPEFEPLLRGMPLGGCVLTMGAAHIVRSHARFLTGELLAHYVTWKGRGSVARSDQQSVRARIWVHRPRSSRLHDRSARTTTAVA